MGLLLSTRRSLLGGVGGYNERVLKTGPIAYWPQNEPTGTVAHCLVNPAQNGTYTGVTLANDATGPFGMPAPFYDGANDYLDVETAPLVTAWNAGGAEWSILIWWKVAAAGVWADAAWRNMYAFTDTANDYAVHTKAAVANRTYYAWYANATPESVDENGVTSTGWNCSFMTRSETVDEVKYYRNATLLETDTTIDNWGSAGAWSVMAIGASSLAPTQPWHGWLGPVGLWPRALPPGEIAKLYNY